MNSCTRRLGIEPRIGGADIADDFAGQRDGGDVVDAEQLGAQPIVDIVGVIGDVVGERRRPAPRALGKLHNCRSCRARIVEDRLRHAVLAVAGQRLARAVGERAVVLDQPLQRLPGEIEPVEGRIAALQRGHHAQRLRIVIEAAERREAFVERALAGMAERRMAEIVGQRQRLGQILVEAERTGQRAGDLRHFERVGEPGAVMVALVEHEHLGLVLEPAEGGRVDDAVAVAAEGAAAFARRLRMQPAAA